MKITCKQENKVVPYEVQGEHIDFTNTGSILKHFNIRHYAIKSEEQNQGNMSLDLPIGMDRYKDFIVIYDISWGREKNCIYFIYDKTKPFTPKTILTDIDSIEFPQYLIEELFVSDNEDYRVTKVKPFINSNINWLKLLQTLKSKLRFYPLVDQKRVNTILSKSVDNDKDGVIFKTQMPAIFRWYSHIFEIFALVLGDSDSTTYIEYENFVPIREWKK